MKTEATTTTTREATAKELGLMAAVKAGHGVDAVLWL